MAHHADDQVELFFLRLLRGAGSDGLAGMRWSNASPADARVTLVRPLLGIPKAALEEFALSNNLRWREDATNRSTDVLRNRVRLELLPLLKKDFQPALSTVVSRTMALLGAEADCVEDLVRAWRKTPGDFALLPEAVQRRVMLAQLLELGLTGEFEAVEWLRLHPGEVLTMAGASIWRDVAGKLHRRAQQPEVFNSSTRRVSLRGIRGEGSFGGIEFRWEVCVAAGKRPSPGPCGECFDADAVGREIVMRHWQAGDRFQPIGLGQSAKLQDLFTNAKVSTLERRRRIVATRASGENAGELWWVEGLRIGEVCKVTSNTRRWLIWRWKRSGQNSLSRR
jgi:tRNA(Ile)-lysidine synthase